MKSLLWHLSVLVLVAPLVWTCENQLQPSRKNQPPTTTIANIPSENDTINGLSVLHWDGGDVDGYILGFEYRYRTVYLGNYLGDSAETDWNFTESAAETIAFNSKDTLNRQFLWVRAVDNANAVDPTPATKNIYTYPTARPKVQFRTPADGEEFLARETTSDWWRGIKVEFEGEDDDGEIVQYGWAVDGGEWTWTRDTVVYIHPDEFQPPLEGEHSLVLTAVDNTNLLSDDPGSINIRLQKPRFDKRLLIIDETDEENFASGINYTDAQVDSFYDAVFPGGDHWNYYSYKALPPQSELGRYKLIVWHGDNPTARGPHVLPQYTREISEYLNVGGNLVVSGMLMLSSFRPDDDPPHVYTKGDFIHDYLHINEVFKSPPYPGDCTGVVGHAGFIDTVRVDTTMLKRNMFYDGKLTSIDIIPRGGKGNFTTTIFTYLNGDENLHLLGLRGGTCGIVYYGTSFNTVTLGFPLFYFESEGAIAIGSMILEKLEI